ncbi:hypothetical protein [Bacillus cihuensis]|nr:hypothetical protein [Bacillus cihuensis]
MKKKVVGMMFALFIVAGLGFIGYSTGTSGGSVGTFELPSEY